jgi:hypothetical protein
MNSIALFTANGLWVMPPRRRTLCTVNSQFLIKFCRSVTLPERRTSGSSTNLAKTVYLHPSAVACGEH